MEGILQAIIFLLCLSAPLGLIAVLAIAWLLGSGAWSIPGVDRGQEKTADGWTTVKDLVGGLAKFAAVVSGAAGSLLGFAGFLLPWFRLEVSGVVEAVGETLGASIGGQMSGIAIAFYSFIGGVGLIVSKDAEFGTVMTGLILVLFSFIVFLIPIALGVLAALGIGMIASPLKLIKAKLAGLARIMLPVSLIGFVLICLIFSCLQATIGGIGISGSAGELGSLMAGVVPAGGFVLTVCGLLLTVFSAVMTISIAPLIEDWMEKLSKIGEV